MNEASSTKQQYISFRLADKVLMSPLSLIEEVSDPLPVTAIAGTQTWFRGLASKKGQLLPVSDLGDYAIKKPSRFDSGAKWLIVTRDNETIGLIVDEVIGLTEREEESQATTEPNSALDDTPLGPLVTRMIQDGDDSAAVIDLGRLLTQQRFVQVGSQAGAPLI